MDTGQWTASVNQNWVFKKAQPIGCFECYWVLGFIRFCGVFRTSMLDTKVALSVNMLQEHWLQLCECDNCLASDRIPGVCSRLHEARSSRRRDGSFKEFKEEEEKEEEVKAEVNRQLRCRLDSRAWRGLSWWSYVEDCLWGKVSCSSRSRVHKVVKNSWSGLVSPVGGEVHVSTPWVKSWSGKNHRQLLVAAMSRLPNNQSIHILIV